MKFPKLNTPTILVVVMMIGFAFFIGGRYYKKVWPFDIPTPTPTPPATTAFVRLTTTGNSSGSVIRGFGEHFYVAGIFDGTLTHSGTTHTTRGGKDIFLTKVKNDGTIEWLQTYGGTENDLATDIAIDETGNPYVTINYSAGFQIAGTTLTGTAGGFQSSLLAKINPADGSIAWHTEAAYTSTNGHVLFTDVDVDRAANVVVTGTIDVPAVTFGSGPATQLLDAPAGTTPAFIAKYEAGGGILTQLSIFGNGKFEQPHLCLDRNSSRIITTFTFNGTATLGTTTVGTPTTFSNLGYAFLEADASVVPVSVRVNTTPTALEPSQSRFGTVVQDVTGNFFMTGYFIGDIRFETFSETSPQPIGFIFKVNPTTYSPDLATKIHGSVTRIPDIGIGANNQILFTSSFYDALRIGAETIFTTGETEGANAFLANYTNALTKSWVHRTTAASYESGNAVGISVASNGGRIAFTGVVSGEIFWHEAPPAGERAEYTTTENFLMVITGY